MKYKSFKIIICFLLIALLSLGILGYLNKNEKIKEDNVKEDTSEVKEEVKHAKLTFVGDFLYEDPYYNALDNGEDINEYFSLVKDYFKDDDISVGNMEVVISDGTIKRSGSNYTFCAPLEVGKNVADLDLEVLSLANNHSNDQGKEGRISSINFFKNNSDILTVGTYKSVEEKNIENNIIESNGIKFGFLAYTYGTNKGITSENRDAISYFKSKDKVMDENYKNMISNEVNTLKQKVDVLIVLMHWGTEFTLEIDDEQKDALSFLNGLGVDIIVGSHPHTMQKINWYKGENKDTLVYYSMGNFVSADSKVSRAKSKFLMSYQIGLLSTLEVTKTDKIVIDNIKTEPIINYFDKDERNYLLIPLSKYTTEYETTHYLYNKGFNKEFINNLYEEVIDKEYR